MEVDHIATRQNIEKVNRQLEDLCDEIKAFVKEKRYGEAKMLYRKAMEKAMNALKDEGVPVTTRKIRAE